VRLHSTMSWVYVCAFFHCVLVLTLMFVGVILELFVYVVCISKCVVRIS
jgi:hypothetical protein